MRDTDIIDALVEVLKARRQGNPQDSYVASLYAKGLNKILEKVGEEATEVVLAAKDADPAGRDDDLVGEVADLWFHSLVLLVHLNQEPAWVLDTLAARFGISGHEEKANR
ncbi:MAG: phosphoribosyl-ATP diphosphatase [Pseudomonadales bacterium]